MQLQYIHQNVEAIQFREDHAEEDRHMIEAFTDNTLWVEDGKYCLRVTRPLGYDTWELMNDDWIIKLSSEGSHEIVVLSEITARLIFQERRAKLWEGDYAPGGHLPCPICKGARITGTNLCTMQLCPECEGAGQVWRILTVTR